MGAWIETLYGHPCSDELVGRAPRGRVDRNVTFDIGEFGENGRAPRGRVDRNFHKIDEPNKRSRRAPRGRVDRNALVPVADAASLRVAPPVGAWIETTGKREQPEVDRVAPPVGAWIETGTSAPTPAGATGRAPRGRVDRNTTGDSITITGATFAPPVGAWIETSACRSPN